MNPSAAAETPATTAPIALWRVAAAFMHVLHNLFGAPEDVAARHTMRLAAHKLLSSWLRCAEAMMRRLLLIEAVAFAKTNARPLLHLRRARVRKVMGFEADQPEKWRVTFRCFYGPPASRRPAPVHAGGTPAVHTRVSRHDRWYADMAKPVQLRSAWPLAERYEALIRVFNDPLPYAQRLAARLHAEPHRAVELLQAPPEAEHRIDRFADFASVAEERRPRFNSE